MPLIHHFLMEAAERFPDKAALICERKRLSYAEFMSTIGALSAVFVDSGLGRGDRALILLTDKADFYTSCYAVMEAGGIAVPLPEGVGQSSVERIASLCTPRIVVTNGRHLANFPSLHKKLNCKFLLIGGASEMLLTRELANAIFADLESMRGNEFHRMPRVLRDDDSALILFTSATPGKKGVLLSHRNLVSAALNSNAVMKIDSSIREYMGIPLADSFGLGQSLCVHFAGGSLIADNGSINPIVLVQSVIRHECNAISGLPSGFAVFFGRFESLLRQIAPQIRFIELEGAFMPLDHKWKLLEIFPKAHISAHYGPVEAARITFLDLQKQQRKLHTVGYPSPGVSLLIADEDGNRVGNMEMGEVLVKGDHVATRYWDDSEMDIQRYTPDGWFRTGDYGFLDQEGYLHLLGHRDETINAGEMRISPLQVEERIHELYPDCELCVVGIPDPAGIVGEIPVLCYVGKEGLIITPSDLSRALASRLDRSKIPRVVYRLGDFPKTENKELMRGELRKKIIEGSMDEKKQVLQN